MKRWTPVVLCGALGASLWAAPAAASSEEIPPPPLPRKAVRAPRFKPGLQPGRPFDLDVARLRSTLEALPEDERAEQVADWTVYGTLLSSGRPEAEVRRALFDQFPRRDATFEDVAHFDHGPGRRVILDRGVVWLFYLESDPHPEVTLARLADQVRMELGAVPSSFWLIRYRPELRKGAINVTYVRSLPGQELFTDCYGYVEQVVHTTADLGAWLGKVDDVTHARMVEGGVELGGRRFAGARTLGVTLEDVAALYQAQAALSNEGGSGPRALGFELGQTWNIPELVADLQPMETGEGFVDMEKVVERAHRVAEAVKERRSGDASRSEVEVTAGQVADAFPRDVPFMVRLSSSQSRAVRTAVSTMRKPAGIRRRAGPVLPILQLIRQMEASDPDWQDRRLIKLLDYILAEHAVCARYNGPLEGTQVGMTLFYTDLLAKLWAVLDYRQSAPVEAVNGFATLPRLEQLPVLYWPESDRLPFMHLSFGPREDGYAFRPDRSEVSFGPLSTRVSSNGWTPAQPDKDERPTEETRRVSTWWDRHLQRIADYEQQYHRQNQIMKWSVITGWLHGAGALSGMQAVEVDHSQRFERWMAGREDLRYRDAVRLLPQKKWFHGAECLERLSSSWFAQRGGAHRMSGGVELGGEKTLEQGTRISPDVLPESLRRGGLLYRDSSPEQIATLRGARFQLPAEGEAKVVITPPESAYFRSGGTELRHRQLSTTFALQAQGGGDVTVRVGDTLLEALHVRMGERGPRLELEVGAIRRLQAVTEALAETRNRRAVRVAELGGEEPWRRLKPQPGVYLVRSRRRAGALIDGARTPEAAARESFIIDPAGKQKEQVVLLSSGEIGRGPRAAFLASILEQSALSAARADQASVLAELRAKPWQELRVTSGGELVRTFVDVAPPGAAVRLQAPGLADVEARATADALYLKRGDEAPELFEDLATRQHLTGAEVRLAIQAVKGAPEGGRVELVPGAAPAAVRELVEAAGIEDPQVLEEAGRVPAGGHGPDAEAVQGYLRAREEAPAFLRARLSLARARHSLQVRLATHGWQWREVPAQERAVVASLGQVYVEDAASLRSMDADLAPEAALARMLKDGRLVCEELAEPGVTGELGKPSIRLTPTELTEGGRTYAAWTRQAGGRLYRLRLATRPAVQQPADPEDEPEPAERPDVPCAL